MSSKLKKEIAQLSLLDGLSIENTGNLETERKGRIRFTFDSKTQDKLNKLTGIDKENEKKKGHKGNWYPKDTLTKMINDRYEYIKFYGK